MKIYTKTGDDGTTGLFGGQRVPKDDARIEAYGSVDELNSIVGLVRALGGLAGEHDELLGTIQEQLFVVGADLATPTRKDRANISIPRVTSKDLECLESSIDKLEATLPGLKHFILPGGSPAGAALHMARTVARRAERQTVRLVRNEPEMDLLVVQYLNRLSDLLFVLARAVNNQAGTSEHPWIPNPRSTGNEE